MSHISRVATAGAAIFALIVTCGLPAVSASATSHGGRVAYETSRLVCGHPTKRAAECMAMRRIVSTHAKPGARAFILPKKTGTLTIGPKGGLTPADLAKAYGVNTNAGAGDTIAIVDAFADPTIQADLNTFDTKYSLPACQAGCLQIYGQSGGPSTAPADNQGWSIEVSLDVETAHAMCHLCKIDLIEANQGADNQLSEAENTAASLHPTVITNSFGDQESSFSASNIASFNHPGIPIVASTGDDGYYSYDQQLATNQPDDPASLPTVIGVGGTSLALNQSGARSYETVWNDNGPQDIDQSQQGSSLGATGGGCSLRNKAEGWQTGLPNWNLTTCGSKRLGADISADADPFTGLDIISSYDCGKQCEPVGWQTDGGTSLAAPIIASMFALAGGGHGVTYPGLTLYGHQSSSAFYDVTVGGDGWCDGEGAPQCGNVSKLGFGNVDCDWSQGQSKASAGLLSCDAAKGYDGASGWGTPNGLSGFSKVGPSGTVAGPATDPAGTQESWSVSSVKDPFPGGAVTKYTWAWGDGSPETVTTAANSTHTFANAGTFTITVKMTDSYQQSASATFQYTAS